MALIPDWFVEELLGRTDIVDLIESRLTLKKSGTNYSACCPFHQEKTPSFVVFGRNQNYHCFGCGAHGDAITFIRESDGLGYVEAIEALAARAGVPIPEASEANKQASDEKERLQKAMQAAALFYQKAWKENPFASIAGDYLKKRGLQGQVAKRYQMGLAGLERDSLFLALKESFPLPTLLEAGLVIQDESGRVRDRFRARVLFPIRDKRGHVLGFGGRTLRPDGQPKYLNSPETPLFHKGYELYGLYEATQQAIPKAGMLVVEGYMDVVMLCQHGIPNAVASLGTACTRTQIKKLFKLTPHITFCFDGDMAGKKAAERALVNALPELEDGFTVHFLFLPAEHDPDSFVREYGKAAFLSAMEQAMPLHDYLLLEASAGLHLASLEDKVIFIKRALERIQSLRPGLFKELLLKMLAERADTPLPLIMGQIATPNEGTLQEGLRRTPLKPDAPLLLSERLIFMLLKDPGIGDFEETLPLLQKIGLSHTLLGRIATGLAQGQTALALMHAWSDVKEKEWLQALERRPLTVPKEKLKKEFEDALGRLSQEYAVAQTEILLKKAAKGSLSEEEAQTLSKLLRHKA